MCSFLITLSKNVSGMDAISVLKCSASSSRSLTFDGKGLLRALSLTGQSCGSLNLCHSQLEHKAPRLDTPSKFPGSQRVVVRHEQYLSSVVPSPWTSRCPPVISGPGSR